MIRRIYKVKLDKEVVPLELNLRLKTYDLLTLEAVFRRLPEKYLYNESLISDYKKEKAGYDGERTVDYALSTFPRNDFLIIKGLRLENPPFHFQIDTLILSRKFFLILEIKNNKGTLQYDSRQKQLTQVVDGNKKSYKDPIMQAEAQKNHLQIWLQQFGITSPPIETLVVIAFPSTIIENVHKDPLVYEKIIHTASLHDRIERLEKNIQEILQVSRPLKKSPLQCCSGTTRFAPTFLET
ncbi:nuclease-related domain-containing protein [Virgibacillus doumboii]|uniref:nuclease-related domain-containing protein n=1 Tax=Virgibacillus doumboii TaxID=2697503 RepID=UPI001FE3ACF3|nr:nuclease-related domain-containing protein [Virgibacillus doumboii]